MQKWFTHECRPAAEGGGGSQLPGLREADSFMPPEGDTENRPDFELPKSYAPSEVEERWYRRWESHGYFHAEVRPERRPYTIVIPPPNITGILTMGHVLNNTIQDILIRWKRMQGYEALWLPGTDHAGIATQHVVEQSLAQEGIKRREIGREEFLRRVWKWREEYGGTIIRQLKRLGTSCDWARERFTMDEGLSNAVREVFVRLYEKDLVYRGKYIVNWCPNDHTALSDDEVNMVATHGKLWYVRYATEGNTESLVVATTRPETLLGDTAVAVNPADDRFRHLVGQTAVVPLCNRRVPVVADSYVDPAFGTGCVKVTPAHDPNDFEIARRHNLESIVVIDDSARMNGNVPEQYRDLDRFEARKRVVADLERLGLLMKTEEYDHSVGHCYRCGTVIEPFLSDQWFVKMKPLAERALEVVLNGRITFYPDRWVKTYEHWMTNIRDWCISRQLWWGHRIPVYYCTNDGCTGMVVSRDVPKTPCPVCGGGTWRQDDDVLDTWFSSWLWPFSTLGWPDETPGLKYFYPTNTLVTAPDIIFFWVARMIMAGMEFMEDIPFRDVYFTGLIRDMQGRKMSKSLGNSPDPIDVMDEYGADALRFTVIYLAPLGQDVLYSNEKVELGRNFANKMWNAGRFLLLNAKTIHVDEARADRHLDIADRWILSRYHRTVLSLERALERFDLNNAVHILYDFVWHDFCDWYVELMKERLYGSEDEGVRVAVLSRAVGIFERILRLLHPFMPFVTEELWQHVKGSGAGETIMRAPYPAGDPSFIDDTVESEMELAQEVVSTIRTMRAELGITPSAMCTVVLKTSTGDESALLSAGSDSIRRLARVESLTIGVDMIRPRPSVSGLAKGVEVFLALAGIVDVEAERRRVEKEIARITSQLEAASAKLRNQSFVGRAPAAVIEREREKETRFSDMLSKLRRHLEEFGR